jgi:uncharacterized protein (TIGR00661 family)
VIRYLAPFKDFQFYIYSPIPVLSDYEHITCHPLSRKGFQKDLYNCAGIISNAGFELASESLQLGKKILAKPLHSQMEQISNAAALKQLGYGHTMTDMNAETIEAWLHDKHSVRITYPNIAKVIVDWMQEGMPKIDTDFTEQVWDSVNVIQIKN